MTERQMKSGIVEGGDYEALRLDRQLCFSLYSTMLAVNKVYRRLLKDLELTYPQYLVMLVLWEGDEINVSEICDRLYLETTTLTPLLKRLEARGLIHRRRSAADERQVIVSLSDQGRQLKDKAKDVPLCMADAVACSSEEIAGLQGQLARLRKSLFENG